MVYSSESSLRRLFYPHSIAVIGASRNPEKVGHQVFKNLLAGKLKIPIFPVNLKAKKVLGKKCFASIKNINPLVDLAVICVPRDFVLPVVEECAEKDVGFIIIISSGFKEAGKIGLELEKRIVDICKKHQIKIIGPNCLGVINTVNSLNASFAESMPLKGNTAFISQSGAMASVLIDWATKENFGLSFFVSLGNRAGINENQILNFLKNQKRTRAIALYLESFANGKEFLKICREVTPEKPVIVLIGGRTQEGKKATKTHTGSILSSYLATKVALEEAGCLVVSKLEDFLYLLRSADKFRPVNNKQMKIITNAGGPAILACDLLKKNKLCLSGSCVKNPLDLGGDATPEDYYQAILDLTRDEKDASVLIIITLQAVTKGFEIAKMIIKASKLCKKANLLPVVIGGQKAEAVKAVFKKKRFIAFDFPSHAIFVLGKMFIYYQKRHNISPKICFVASKVPDQVQKKLIPSQLLNFPVIKKLLNFFELNLVPSFNVGEFNRALTFAEKVGFPVVLKNLDFVHKTEAHAYVLNIKNINELKNAFAALSKKSNNLLLQKQIDDGFEFFIGVKEDPNFGHLLVFGKGGIYAEVFKDFTYRIMPITKNDAEVLIREVKCARVINGFRGSKPLNHKILVKTLVNISKLICAVPQIKELDINPFILTDKGGFIIDPRINL